MPLLHAISQQTPRTAYISVTIRYPLPDGGIITQVHAVSSKASDVRSVVMELNAKRQAADEAEDAPLPALGAQEGHTVPEQDKIVTWQE